MAGNPLEDYLRRLRDIRRSGSAVPETSFYPALIAMLDAVGATLKPKVRCVPHPNSGDGIPACSGWRAGWIAHEAHHA